MESGLTKITDGSGTVIAAGDRDSSMRSGFKVQVRITEDNGLQQGAYYTITNDNSSGWQGAMFTGMDGTLGEFEISNATVL